MSRHAELLAQAPSSWEELRAALVALRGDPSRAPELAVVVPVNARGDQDKVRSLLTDLTRYAGSRRIETVIVLNNYLPEHPPAELPIYSALPVRLLTIPNLRRNGEAVAFTARIVGIRAAGCDLAVSFDADCRIPNPTALLDWYVSAFSAGAAVAYSHVDYHELNGRLSVTARILIHHLARWGKRTLLRVPTARGSNYGVLRTAVLPLYDAGMLADEMNVAPTVKANGGRIMYSGRRELVVLTSGRMFGGGWLKLARYLAYRLRYNWRVIPVGNDAASRTGRAGELVRCYVDDKPVLTKR